MHTYAHNYNCEWVYTIICTIIIVVCVAFKSCTDPPGATKFVRPRLRELRARRRGADESDRRLPLQDLKATHTTIIIVQIIVYTHSQL